MTLVPNPNSMIINTKSLKFSMLGLPYTKSDVGLVSTKFLAYPTRMGWAKLVFSWANLGFRTAGPMRITYLKSLQFSQRLRGGKRRSQNLHPTFKIGLNARQTNELFIESFHKKDHNHIFVLLWESLQNNSNWFIGFMSKQTWMKSLVAIELLPLFVCGLYA